MAKKKEEVNGHTQGYITGLAYTEVTGWDADGELCNTIRTRVKRNDGTWVTNHDARNTLKDDYGAVKFKRRNVWKFEEVEK